MRVKWLGHAAFLLSWPDGTRIITDPYLPGCFGNTLRYGPIDLACDAATESHNHEDHAGAHELPGGPKVVRGRGRHTVKSVTVTGHQTAHDDAQGAKRGRNLVFVFQSDGVKLCHLGDLGETLPRPVAAEIGQVDVLLAPVGGFFTIDATEAHRISAELRARITIPMHYKTDKCTFTIDPLDRFIAGRADVRRTGLSEVEITREKLPRSHEIWVLNHAL